MKKSMVAIAMGATALSPFVATSVTAQVAQRTSGIDRYDIPAGGLAEALQTWSKITRRQIIYRMDDVGRKQTKGLKGDYGALARFSICCRERA